MAGFGRGSMLAFSPRSGLNLQSINATIGWEVLLYGVAAALVIAIAGSATAAWLISKVRPAEVMRTE
jgi:ABC-type antimicrobial peptide transport system permease subunit